MTPSLSPVRSRSGRLALALCAALSVSGCGFPPEEGGGQGPGHRQQPLALSPRQELELGRDAYREVLTHPQKYGRALPADSPEVERVRRVMRRLVAASRIEPLQREINLRVQGYRFEWEVNVLRNRQINAFCLPGGKMVVFTGILPVAANDDQLATVLSHEMAHALAHHSSERVARDQNGQASFLMSKKYDRMQESEADHIGLFLMTFAGYDPDEAVRFWRRMAEVSQGGQLPEIFSDHPSDARRIQDMRRWVPQAKAALEAYKEGRIAPAPGR
ncbi:MAG TPA: M48 family metallopeptidase [Gemmataceae bacterium]|nr:M48 family metallopeptidase [Gemmataceae bacterium]